ncbi:MAG: ankyrin repeat domain-containing protein [Colwellia sp.]|nr:ankyrin repeat domain-containing protein [Colwellia sp.]
MTSLLIQACINGTFNDIKPLIVNQLQNSQWESTHLPMKDELHFPNNLRVIDRPRSAFCTGGSRLTLRGPEQLGHIDSDGNTALIVLCLKENHLLSYEETNKLCLLLVLSGNTKPYHKNKNNDTALIISLESDLLHVAMAIIKSGQCNPTVINNGGACALDIAISKAGTDDTLEIEEIIIELLQTSGVDPGRICPVTGNTPLLNAISQRLETVALLMLQTRRALPGHQNNDGDTALILACSMEFSSVVYALIVTGDSVPDAIDSEGDTALMIAITHYLEKSSLDLIRSGRCSVALENYDLSTALELAIANGMETVATELIQTGCSNPEHVNFDEQTALDIAIDEQMESVVSLLIIEQMSYH